MCDQTHIYFYHRDSEKWTIFFPFIIKSFLAECFTIFSYLIFFFWWNEKFFLMVWVHSNIFCVKLKKNLQMSGTSSRKFTTIDGSIVKDHNESYKKISSELPYSPNFIFLFQSMNVRKLLNMFIRLYFTGTKQHFSSQELFLERNTVFVSLKKKTTQKWVTGQQ